MTDKLSTKTDKPGIGKWPWDKLLNDHKKTESPLAAFERKLVLPRKRVTAAHDVISNLVAGGGWFVLPELRRLILDPLREDARRSGAKDDAEPENPDCDIWEVTGNGSNVRRCAESIMSQRSDDTPALTLPFDVAYSCMLLAAESGETVRRPWYFFCELPKRTNEVFALVLSSGLVVPSNESILGKRQYLTNIVTALKLSGVSPLPRGARIIVPEDQNYALDFTHKVRSPKQLPKRNDTPKP